MNNQTEHSIIFRDGNSSDNEGLLRLTSLTPMIGRISIRIDRQPDFFRLLEKRGKYYTIVAQKGTEIIGSCTITEMNVLLNHKHEVAHYISDFRVHPDYKKSTLAARLGKTVHQKLISLNARLLFGTIVEGNNSVMPFLSGRLLFPHVFGGSTFNVYQIIPSFIEKKSKKYIVNELEKPNLEIFNDFINEFSFSTALYEDKYNETKVLTASYKGKIVAALALTDAENYKQDILIDIPNYLKVLQKGINFTNKIVPIFNLPQLNESIKILYVRLFTYDEGFEDALELLISRARKIAFSQKYHFLAAGVHDRSRYNKLFSNYLKIDFKTQLYFSSLDIDKEMVNSIENGTLFWDFSL
ncbi:MAG TPA: GNAT family N-acetyltransferase [Paludibacter sp.]|nr:GNAT family N-acetyltransferase [Paludibacter sp.]